MNFTFNKNGICENPIIDRYEPKTRYRIKVAIAKKNKKWVVGLSASLSSGGFGYGVGARPREFKTKEEALHQGWSEIVEYLKTEPSKSHCYIIEPAQVHKLMSYAEAALAGQLELF